MADRGAPSIWMRRTAAAVGCIAGIACAILLLCQGIPDDLSVETTITTSSHSRSSGGCHVQCKKPKMTVSNITVKSHTRGGSGADGALEKAFDNDTAVTIIRLLLALLAGAAIAVAVLRLLVAIFGTDDGPDDGVASERSKNKSKGGGGAAKRAEKPGMVTWHEEAASEKREAKRTEAGASA